VNGGGAESARGSGATAISENHGFFVRQGGQVQGVRLHERGRDEVGGGAAIDENDCGFAGDGTLQLEEATAGGGDLVTFLRLLWLQRRRRRGGGGDTRCGQCARRRWRGRWW